MKILNKKQNNINKGKRNIVEMSIQMKTQNIGEITKNNKEGEEGNHLDS